MLHIPIFGRRRWKQSETFFFMKEKIFELGIKDMKISIGKHRRMAVLTQ